MKRNENIIPLSREHHLGLLFNWKIKEGLKKDVTYDRIRNYIQYFWNEHLCDHFIEEEQSLFTQSTDEYTQVAIKEHNEIRALIQSINSSNDKALLTNFVELLQRHIRFEERILFPYLEKTLSNEVLQKIGKLLWDTHLPKTDNYEDEFWK